MMDQEKFSLKTPNFPKKIIEFPKTRSFVTDVCDRAKKKNIIYGMAEIDVTELRIKLKEIKRNFEINELDKEEISLDKTPFSLTTYILYEYAKCISNAPKFNAYRRGNVLEAFDDVDVSVMVEKEVNNQMQPIHYIIRAADKKSFHQIQSELKFAQSKPYEEMVKPEDRFFFSKVSKRIRNLLWIHSNKKPDVFKKYTGTVGLTNMGMFGSGAINLLPLTPMTTTLAIGTIEEKLKMIDNKVCVREMLHITIGVDHNIIDGVPLLRFIMSLKDRIESCENMVTSPNSIIEKSTTKTIIETQTS